MTIETYKDFIEFSSVVKDDALPLDEKDRANFLEFAVNNYLSNGYVEESREGLKVKLVNAAQNKSTEIFVDELGRYFKNGNRFIAKNLRKSE